MHERSGLNLPVLVIGSSRATVHGAFDNARPLLRQMFCCLLAPSSALSYGFAWIALIDSTDSTDSADSTESSDRSDRRQDLNYQNMGTQASVLPDNFSQPI